jgi:uncharacterized glyoxalase superfamily protein PhnB
MISNRSIPRCTVIPQLAYPDVLKAVDWLCAAFGFTLRLTIGNHRVQLNVGDGALVIMESNFPPDAALQSRHPSEFGHVMIRIDEIDRHSERAKQHGAKVVRAPADYPYGERQYTAEDFAGRLWTFSQSIADVAPESWGGTSVHL